MAHIDLDTDAIFQQVMATPRVNAKARERSTKIANKIRLDLAKAGIDATVTVEKTPTATGRASYNVKGSVKNPQDSRRAGRIARRAARSIRR